MGNRPRYFEMAPAFYYLIARKINGSMYLGRLHHNPNCTRLNHPGRPPSSTVLTVTAQYAAADPVMSTLEKCRTCDWEANAVPKGTYRKKLSPVMGTRHIQPNGSKEAR